ncbi:MAG: hypothetical protein WAM11_14690 [Cyanobium sp.]
MPGSHSIPAARLVSSELPDGDLILISEQPRQALELIDQLHRNGYSRRIQYLEGGLPHWQRQGLPLEAGELVHRRRGAQAEPQPLITSLLLRLLRGAWTQTRAKA